MNIRSTWDEKIELFSLFTLWPDASSYICKISLRLTTLAPFALMNIKLSSAKRRCEIQGDLLQTLTPLSTKPVL
jgi:hypothetical protein